MQGDVREVDGCFCGSFDFLISMILKSSVAEDPDIGDRDLDVAKSVKEAVDADAVNE